MLSKLSKFIYTLPLGLVLLARSVLADETTVPVSVDAVDPVKLAQMVLEAVNTKNWGLLVSAAVTALVWAARRFVPEHTKVGTFMRTRLGGLITNFAFVLGGGFITLFIAHKEPTAALVWQTLDMVLKAAGGWAIVKNMMDAANEAKAQKAGVAVVAIVPDPPSDPLNK